VFLTLETSPRSDTHDLQALRRGCPVGALAASSSGGSIAADHAAACSVLLFVRQGPSPHRIFPSCGSGSSCAPHGPLYRPVTACHARSRRMAWLATARAVPVRGLAMSPERRCYRRLRVFCFPRGRFDLTNRRRGSELSVFLLALAAPASSDFRFGSLVAPILLVHPRAGHSIEAGSTEERAGALFEIKAARRAVGDFKLWCAGPLAYLGLA